MKYRDIHEENEFVHDKILKALEGGSLTFPDLAGKTGVSRDVLVSTLSKLHKTGRITKTYLPTERGGAQRIYSKK